MSRVPPAGSAEWEDATAVIPAPPHVFDSRAARPSVRWLRGGSNAHASRDREIRREISLDAVLSLPTGKKYAFRTANVSPTGVLLGARAGQNLPLQPGLSCSIRLIWDLNVIDLETELVRIVRGAAGPEGPAQGFAFHITRADRAQLELYRSLIARATTESAAEADRPSRPITVKRMAFFMALATVAVALALMIRSVLRPVEVRLTRVSRGEVSETVSSSADGEVVSTQRALLKVMSTATSVLEVPVSRGQRVKAGDLLVRLDERPLLDAKRHAEAELGVARAQRRKAERQAKSAAADLSVDRALEKSGALSPAEARRQQNAALAAGDTAQVMALTVEGAEAIVVARTNEVAYARALAPFDGVVADVFARPGDSVVPGASLVDLVNDGNLRVDVPFDESDAARIAKGMKARVLVPGIKEPLIGAVRLVSPVARVDAKGAHSVIVEIELPRDDRLRVGSTANVDVVVRSEDNALRVPTQALVTTPEGKSVYVVDDRNRLRRVPVTTSLASFDVVAIEPGPVPEAAFIALDPNEPAVKDGAHVARP